MVHTKLKRLLNFISEDSPDAGIFIYGVGPIGSMLFDEAVRFHQELPPSGILHYLGCYWLYLIAYTLVRRTAIDLNQLPC